MFHRRSSDEHHCSDKHGGGVMGERSTSMAEALEGGDAERGAPQEEAREQQQPPPRGRKVALVFGYNGSQFQGMQINPGATTVEGSMLAALHHAGLCSSDSEKAVFWSRAARTDKGVSASGQTAAFRLLPGIRPECVTPCLNQSLPADIRAYGCVETTSSFNARTSCDSRTYEYIAPVFAFDPSAYRSKALQDSLKIGQKRDFDPAFTLSDEHITRLNNLLHKFVGAHNFHNFTVKVSPTDATVNRIIYSFECSNPFFIDNMQCVSIVVQGQSFMLHQIRKMVGTAIAVDRGDVSESRIDLALKSRSQVTAPMAPETGLFLRETGFKRYNSKWGHLYTPLKVSDFAEEVKRFKTEVIYPHIVQTERREGIFAHWLRSMNSSSLHQVQAPPSAAQRVAQEQRIEQQQAMQDRSEQEKQQRVNTGKRTKGALGRDGGKRKRVRSTWIESFDPEWSDS
jgi:tRNA pseudouridine38-40 synthase